MLAWMSPAVQAENIPPGCKGNGLGISLFVSQGEARVGDTLYYSLQISNQEFPACRATDIQSVIVTPDGDEHEIVLRRTTLNPGESDFYDKVVSYVVRAQDIQQPNGTVTCSCVTVAVINQSTDETAQNRRDVNTVVVNPCLGITAACEGGVGEGSPISFDGTVRNCGDITLEGVTVTNTLTGELVFGPATLEPGQEAAFSGAYPPSDPCGGTAQLVAHGYDTLQPAGAVNAATSVTCGNATTPNIEVTYECPSVPPMAGDPLTYTGTVRNTGDVTLQNVMVVCDRPETGTVVFTADSLAPGESASFSGSFPTPADACSVSARLTASGLSGCTEERVSSMVESTCPLATQGQMALSVNCPSSPVVPGGTAVYTGVVSNPGAVTLTNIRVVNTADPEVPVFTLETLAPGAQAAFSAEVPVPAGACAVTTGFAATASDRCDNSSISASDSATCPVVTTPAISVTHNCPEEALAPGGSASFAGTVQNTGNVTLTNVRVMSNDTVLLGPAKLQPGESASFVGTVTAPMSGCSFTTTVLATGTDSCTDEVVESTSTRTCPVLTSPDLVITKECPGIPPAPGGEITYIGAIQNTGDVPLVDVTVTDGNVVVFGPVTLAPGEKQALSQTTVAPVTGCSVTSAWTARGSSECTGEQITRTVEITCPIATQAGLSVSLNCPADPLVSGGDALYTGVVSNTGDVTLTNVIVLNNLTEESVLTVPALAPGGQAAFSYVMSVPGGACSQTASVSASAADQCGGRGVTDTATVTCPVITHPAIAITHDCPSSLMPGGSAALPGAVKNTGDVTLTDVTVYRGEMMVFGPATLEPGQSASFEAPVTVPADTCSLTTTLTATGVSQCGGEEVTSTSTQVCPVTTAPDFVLTKECPDSPAPGGGTITYRGSLANTGNVTLLNLAVADNGALVIAVPSLAPGAVTNFTFTMPVPPNVCSVTDTWVATASGQCDHQPITRTATTTCSVLGSPEVALTVQCGGPVNAGATATYAGVVANTGNVTLTNVVVRVGSSEGSESTSGEPVYSIAQLLPGASASFTATVPVPTDLCELGTLFTATAAGACSGQMTSDSASASCPVISAPAISVTHECPAEPGVPGTTTSFHGRVTNTGNITLTNVVVVHNLTGEPVFGPAELAPGQMADFVGTYTVPEDLTTCTYPSQVTATGNDRCSGTPVRAESQIHCPLFTVPGIEVEVSCGAPAPQGSIMAYTGVVRNTGTVQLNDVKLVSSNTGSDRVVAYWAVLPAGASVPFGVDPKLGIYVTNDCCSVTHTLTVTAVDNCSGQEVKDTTTKTCPVLFHPRLSVTVQPPAEPLEPGDTLRYTGTVSNVGDVTMVDVYVRNFIKDEGMEVIGPITLVPGQTVHFNHSFTVPEGFCGDMKLVASGDSLCGELTDVTAAAEAKCQVMTTPGIFVVKNCPTTPLSNEGVFTYTGTVINVGNAPLKNVMVYSDKPAPNTPVFGPVNLDAGESADFTASYTVCTECCQSVDVLVAKGQDACSGIEVSNTGASACPVRYSPAIQVTKTCVGDNAFTGTVENVGDITLLNVTVKAGETLLLGPIELAPGEVKRFTSASYAEPNPDEALAYAGTDVPVVAEGTALCDDYVVRDSAVCKTVGTDSLAILGIQRAGDGFLIRWAAKPGIRYRVECCDTLGGEWRPVGEDIQAAGGTAEVLDAEPGDGARFYRVRRLAE